MNGDAQVSPHAQVPFDHALSRARADFLEMPGLRLSAAQARRLWTIDLTVCNAVLATLVDTRFLARANDLYFVRTD